MVLSLVFSKSCSAYGKYDGTNKEYEGRLGGFALLRIGKASVELSRLSQTHEPVDVKLRSSRLVD